MDKPNISAPDSAPQKPFSDKLTVTPELHQTTYQHFIKAMESVAITKHLIAGIPEIQIPTTPKDEPNTGDTELLAGVLLERIGDVAEFLDILHCAMSVQEVSQTNDDGGSDNE